MTKAHGFSREERLRRQVDFQRVYDRRCSTSDAWLVVYGCPNELAHTRLGLSVGRKWGKAHDRNRIRRLFKEAFRLTKALLPAGLDLILIPRRTDDLGLSVLVQSLPRLARQLAQRLAREANRR
jgi:ribonuclease P protein component